MENKIIEIVSDLYNYYEFPYGNRNKIKDIIHKEDQLYNELTLEELESIYTKYKTLYENQQDFSNHEIILFNDKNLSIIRRIFLRIYKQMLQIYVPENNSKDMLLIGDKKLSMKIDKNLYNNAKEELKFKISSKIELRFLDLLLYDENLFMKQKMNIIHKSMFINPYLEEELINNNFDVDNLIEKENLLFKELWDIFKTFYIEEMYTTSCNRLLNEIYIMRSKLDINKPFNSYIRSIYLRSLLCNLDNSSIQKTLSEIEEDNFDIFNEEGELNVKYALSRIETDRAFMNKKYKK